MVDQPTTPETPSHAAEDDQAVLAPVSPEFNPDDTTGVDVESFPALQDFKRMLPANRLRVQTDTAKMAQALPAKFTEQGTGTQALDELTGDDLDSLAGMFESIQDMLLRYAEDNDAMTDWLIAQEDPIKAVLYGFSQFQAALGN